MLADELQQLTRKARDNAEAAKYRHPTPNEIEGVESRMRHACTQGKTFLLLRTNDHDNVYGLQKYFESQGIRTDFTCSNHYLTFSWSI